MGGKSGGDQVTGYQYYANLVVMIGNRIEELKAINFDKRGWILNDEQIADPRAKMLFDTTYNFTQSGIYGKDEGGIAGSLGLRVGNALPAPDSKYAEYLQSKGFPALSYPYLSYLIFKGRKPVPKFGLLNSSSPVSESGFYFGNNPFLKEMMLWVKRTRVRNDGRVQWYETRSDGAIVCEIGAFYSDGGPSSRYRTFPLLMSGEVYWFDSAGEHKESWLSGEFPFYDVSQSYYSDVGVNGPAMKVLPSSIAAKSLLDSHDVRLDSGTILPPCTWSSYPPATDGFWNGAVERYFDFTGEFKWVSGNFIYKAFLSENNASIVVQKKTDSGEWFNCLTLQGHLDAGFKYIEGQRYLETGQYKIMVRTGNRYLHENTPRPLAHLLVKYKDHESEISSFDINPIHKIREILTDDTAMNISESEMNDDIFIQAADQIWDEGLGISCVFTEKNCKEALDEICAHIEAGVRVNRQTGKYEVILFRDNWLDLENALHFDKANIKRGSFSVEVMNTDDAINVLNVNYYDRANIKNSSFNVYENGLIQTMGRENAETVDFPYFMNQRNAEIVANWKLKQLSTPAWRGSFATSARAARKLNRYDIVKITWSSKQIHDMPVRVMKINLGTATDTSIVIDFVEVVSYSSSLNSSIVVDAPVSGVLPPQSSNPIAFEVPYHALVQLLGQREADAQLEYNPELGYLGVAAEKPQNNSLNALLYTEGGTGDYLKFQKVGVVDYSSGIYLDQQISQIDASFAVIDLDYVQNGVPKFSGVAVGTIGQLNSELISFVSYNAETKILIVKRGVHDTVPAKHISGNIHFWGESFAYDSTEYSVGETVGAQVLTTTPSGVDSLNPGGVKTVEMNARAIRPYPPANVKINNEYFPQEIETDLILTWVDRNRVQQTGGEILGWFDAGVTLESGVTYQLILIERDKNKVELRTQNLSLSTLNTYTFKTSAMVPNTSMIEITLKSLRDGYESYGSFNHMVELSQLFSPPYDLTVEYKND